MYNVVYVCASKVTLAFIACTIFLNKTSSNIESDKDFMSVTDSSASSSQHESNYYKVTTPLKR